MKKQYQAAIVLGICGTFLFLKYIAQLFPSLISNVLIEQYQLSGVSLGILASSYYYSYTIMQIGSGIILDKYSLRIPAFLSIFLVACGLIIFPHTDSLFTMCLSRVLLGIGCSFATTLYMKAATLWTNDRIFLFISSLLATATMIGAAVGSAPVASLFQVTGWKNGLIWIAYFGFALSVLALIFVKQNKSHQASTESVSAVRLKEIIFNRKNIVLLFYSGVTFSPVVVLGGLWGVPFLELKFSASINDVAKLISLMFLGHAVGSPVWALLSGYLKNKKHLMLLANVTAFASLSIILFGPVSYGGAEYLFFVFGFSVGAFMLSFDICRQNNAYALMGFAVAFINSGEGIVSSILEPGIGFALDLIKSPDSMHFSLENYQVALSILPVCFVISTWLVYKLPFVELQILPWFRKRPSFLIRNNQVRT